MSGASVTLGIGSKSSDPEGVEHTTGATLHMTAAELMTEILDKPALYVTHGSVTRISAFISGFLCGRGEGADPIYGNFGQWLRKKFEIRQDFGWASIISFIGKSETGAFELAKEMWAKYLQEVRTHP